MMCLHSPPISRYNRNAQHSRRALQVTLILCSLQKLPWRKCRRLACPYMTHYCHFTSLCCLFPCIFHPHIKKRSLLFVLLISFPNIFSVIVFWDMSIPSQGTPYPFCTSTIHSQSLLLHSHDLYLSIIITSHSP